MTKIHLYYRATQKEQSPSKTQSWLGVGAQKPEVKMSRAIDHHPPTAVKKVRVIQKATDKKV
jgi:hypothetical protein